MRLRPLGIALLSLAFVAACSGPGQQVEVDVQGELADLRLPEARSALQSLPMPPYVEGSEQVKGVPTGWVKNPDLVKSGPAKVGSKACPFTDPRQNVVAAVEAPTSPPAEQTYDYFAQGSYEAVSTDGGQNAVMPADTTRAVRNVKWGPGHTYYEFDLVATAVHSTTTSRYRVVLDDPEVNAPDIPRPVNVREPPPPELAPSTEPPIVGTVRVGTPSQPGMYLLSVQAKGEQPLVFNDGGGMLLARWPSFPGDTFLAQATVGNLHLDYTSKIENKGQVEACGDLLDSRAVHISGTATPMAGNAPAVAIDVTYNVATQFGGLIVADTSTTTVGADATSAVRETVSARIKGSPASASAGAPAPSCPSGPSDVPPVQESIEQPPVEGTYRMDVPDADFTVSTYEIVGIDPDAGKLPSTLIRTVRNVQWDASREYFEYETVDDLGGSITTTKYRVVPGTSSSPPPKQPELGSPGMYLVSTIYPDGEEVAYNDGQGMLLVPFPLDATSEPSYSMVGTDGENDVVAASYVSANQVVVACGQPIEGWHVDVVIQPGEKPAPKPEPDVYIDTRLLPVPEPPLPSVAAAPPAPPLPKGPDVGPRSKLELMRTYTDYLHDKGHIKTRYGLTIAPQLGGLIVGFRATASSVDRADEFEQNLAYLLASKPKVPTR